MNTHSDEVIWHQLKHNFCSFSVKNRHQIMCSHKFNVNGVCDRKCCALSNAEYATILEKDGKLILHVKAVERAYQPSTLWDKIDLPMNKEEARTVIAKECGHLDQFMLDKLAMRADRLIEMLHRMRKLKSQQLTAPKMIAIKKKTERREARRQTKALSAAKVETGLKKALLEQLHKGVYNDIYNFHQETFEEAINEEQREAEATKGKKTKEADFVGDDFLNELDRKLGDMEDMEVERELEGRTTRG